MKWLGVLTSAILLLGMTQAQAQSYPSRAITFVVTPPAAAVTTNVMARDG